MVSRKERGGNRRFTDLLAHKPQMSKAGKKHLCLGRRKKIRHRLGGEGCEGRGGKKGFGCAGADMMRFHFHRSGSDSGIPLRGPALFPGALLGACPGAPRLLRCRSPRALRGSPGTCRPPPAPRSDASGGIGQPRRGSRAGGRALSVPPNRSPCDQAHRMGSKSETLGDLWREWT